VRTFNMDGTLYNMYSGYFGCLTMLFFAGGLICKKVNDAVDAPPFIIGMLTLLKQFHSDETDNYIALLGQYARSYVDAATAR